MSEPLKKTLRRAPPTITKRYQPPYTTLRQTEGEKLQTKPAEFTLKSLPEEELTTLTLAKMSEGFRTGMDVSMYEPSSIQIELNQIADQVLTEERKAELEHEAQEQAQASDTTSQLKQNLTQWKKDEVQNLNTQLENSLAEQGITKEMLQSNAKLRRQVTEWKRKSVAEFNTELTKAEQEAITEQQETLKTFQQEQRGALKESFKTYETGVTKEVQSTLNTEVQRLKTEQQQKLSSAKPSPKVTEILAQNKRFDQALKNKEITPAQYNEAMAFQNIKSIDAQNERFKEALDKGEITVEQYNSTVSTQNVNLTSAVQTQKLTIMSNAGWTSSWDSYVKNVEEQKSIISKLETSKVVKVSGNKVELVKPVTKLSTNELSQLQKIGINISLSSITTAQQQEQQQELFSKLEKANVITISGTTASLKKPANTLSDSEITELKKAGFNIPDLVKGPEQYLYELTQERYLKGGGIFDIKGLPRIVQPGMLGRKIQAEIASVWLGDFLRAVVAPYNLAEMLLPEEALGIDLPQIDWRGPTSQTLKYYQDVPMAYQVALDVGSVVPSFLGSYISMVPVGFAAKALSPVALSIASKITSTGTMQNFKIIAPYIKSGLKEIPGVTTTAQLAKGLTKFIAAHPKVQMALVWAPMAGGMTGYDVITRLSKGEPIETILSAQVRNMAIFVGGAAGFSAGMKAGEGLANKLDVLFDRKVWSQLKRKSITEEWMAPDGTIKLRTVINSKDIPRQLRDILKTELDPATGKEVILAIDVTKSTPLPVLRQYEKHFWELAKTKTISVNEIKGAFTDIVGKSNSDLLLARGYDFTQMTPDEILSTITKDLGEKALKIGYNEALGQLKIAKSLANVKSMNANADALINILGKDGYRTLIDKGYELWKLTPDEQLLIAWKELGLETPWAPMLEKISAGQLKMLKILPGTKATQLELLAAYTGEIKSKVPYDIQKLFNQVKDIVHDDKEAAYWVSQILTKSNEQIAGKMLNIIEKGYDPEKLIELSMKFNPAGENNVVAMLKSAGLNQSQISNTIQASALSQSDPAKFVNILAKLDGNSAAQTLQLVTKDVFTQSMLYLETKPLVNIIANAEGALISRISGAVSASMMAQILNNSSNTTVSKTVPYMTTESLSGVLQQINSETLSSTFMALTPEQINKILPNITPQGWSTIVPKLTPDVLNKIIPKLTPEQFSMIAQDLSQDQIPDVIQSVSPEQLAILIEEVPLGTIQTYLQTGIIPTAPIEGIPPFLLKTLLDRYRKRGKTVEGKIATMFDVFLQYHSTSEQFKIKAKSFHGASFQALQRRKNKEIPDEVIVTQVGYQKY